MKFTINITKYFKNDVKSNKPIFKIRGVIEIGRQRFGLCDYDTKRNMKGIIEACKNSAVLFAKYGNSILTDGDIDIDIDKIPKNYDQDKEVLLHEFQIITKNENS